MGLRGEGGFAPNMPFFASALINDEMFLVSVCMRDLMFPLLYFFGLKKSIFSLASGERGWSAIRFFLLLPW